MNTMNSSKQEDDSGGGFGGDHNTVSNLANGIYRIDVAHENDHNVGSTSSFEDEKKSNNGISGNGMVIGTAIATSSVAASSMSNNSYAKASSSASANNNNNNQVGIKYKQNCSNDMEDDCDRSQSSISGASWDAHGRRSSFRSRVGKVYSPRWMDQETSRLDANNNQQSSSYYSETTHVHRRMASSDGYLTDVERMTKRRASRESSETAQHGHNQMNDSASHASQHTHEDSHDEGYLSHSTAEGYQSGGYHSYHPALSYAASVKSDIATVCSGSVVEDIDMAEMASVASDGARKSAAPQHHQAGKDEAKLKNVEFASNILNDMGPPALCSALLLAANAACKPNSSNCSLRSFNNDCDAVSDVVAHVDTDDCCDRSILESEVSTLHSQDDTASQNDNLYECGSDRVVMKSTKHSLPLQRFQQGQIDVSQPNDDGGQLLQLEHGVHQPEGNFNPYFDRTNEDDWSNSRSSMFSDRSLSPSSSKIRSRSRSRSPGERERKKNGNIPSWYREREPRPRRQNNVREGSEMAPSSPVEDKEAAG